MDYKLLYIVDEDNIDEKASLLGQQIVSEGIKAELASVPSDVNKAEYYNAILAETKPDVAVYISGELTALQPDMTLRFLEAFASAPDVDVIGLHGANHFTFDLENWREDLAMCQENDVSTHEENAVPMLREAKFINSRVLAVRNDTGWEKAERTSGLNDYLQFAGHVLDLQKQYKKTTVLVHSENFLANEQFASDYNEKEMDLFRSIYGKMLYPLVSILIPTYNRPDYFPLAFQSVLQQDYPNLEIFISDDGSQDDTEAYIQPYLQDKNLNLRYNHDKSFGFVENWTWLLDNFHGEYYNFLMDDDLFAPNKISRMMDIYQMFPDVTLVTSYRQLIDAQGNRLSDVPATKPRFDKDVIVNGKAVITEVLSSFLNFIGEPTTVLQPAFAKEKMKEYVAENTGFIDLKTWLYLLTYGKMAYIAEPLSCFRSHDGQDQCTFERQINGCFDMIKVFLAYTEDEAYLSRNTAEQIAYEAILPWIVKNMDNLLVKWKEKL